MALRIFRTKFYIAIAKAKDPFRFNDIRKEQPSFERPKKILTEICEEGFVVLRRVAKAFAVCNADKVIVG